MAGPTATYDSFKTKGLRSQTFDESIYRWCTRSPAESITVASTSILSPSTSSLPRSKNGKSSIPCLIKKPIVGLTISSSSSSSSSCNLNSSRESSSSDASDESESKNVCIKEPLIPSASFTVVNASMTSSHIIDSFKSTSRNNILSRSSNFNYNLPTSTEPNETASSSPSASKIKRSTSFASPNNVCSSNCSKLTVSLSSNSFSNVSSRFTRRNLDYLDFSLDSLSVSSSSSCSSTDENKGNHHRKNENELPTMCKIKKEAAKLSESILLRAICELTSDSDISSYSTGTGCGNVSTSSLNRVKPPSIMDRVSSTANTSSIVTNSKGTYFKRRVSKSCSPRKRNTLNGTINGNIVSITNQNSPIHRKSNRHKRNLSINASSRLKSIGQEGLMSTSLDDTSESLLLELTGPPSLMDQVSGCWSEHQAPASIGSAGSGCINNLMTAGSSSANSLNSLNSVSSDIFDLPTSDPAVNQAGSDLVQGIDALTKNHHLDITIDEKGEEEKETDCKLLNEALYNNRCNTFSIVNPNQIDLIIESDEDDDVKSGATYDIKVEKPKLEDVIEEDSLALASSTDRELKLNSYEDQCNTSATFIMDSLRIAQFGPLTDQNVPRQLDKLASISHLPTLKLNMSNKGEAEEHGSSDKSDSDDCRSDFGVDHIPTDNTVTLIANDSNTQIDTGEKVNNQNKITADVLNDSLYIGTTDTSEEIDAIFCNDEEIDLTNLTPSEYEQFLKSEKAKLLAHTFAEMDLCAKTYLAVSSIDSKTDTPLDLSNLSLGLLTNNVGDDIDEDDFDEDTRATYYVSDAKCKKSNSKSTKTSTFNYTDDTTYPIESPSSKGSSESNYFTCQSDTQTYSIDDSSEYKTAVSSGNQVLSTIVAPKTLVMNNGVRIRETRASALRSQRARSLVEKSKLYTPSVQTMPKSKTHYNLSNQVSNVSKIPPSRQTGNLKLSSGYKGEGNKISSSISANSILNDGDSEKANNLPVRPESSRNGIPSSRSMSNVNSRFVSVMRKRVK